jgi:RES domain-containing protein
MSRRDERLAFLRIERARTQPRSFRVWHQGSPRYDVTSVADPPRAAGRYHRPGGVATWYGSRTERGAWAELFRHFLDDGVSPFEIRRRVGRVDAQVVALDLTSKRILDALGVSMDELIADDLSVCQELAELAIEAGFEAIHAPAAPLEHERTLAVFGTAINSNLGDVLDKGIRRAPIRMYDVLRAIRLPIDRAERIGRFFEELVIEWRIRRGR